MTPVKGLLRRRVARSRRAGFSLFELLIVIAILLAIGGIVATNLLPEKDKADAKLVRVQIADLESALKRFKLDLNRFPTADEGLKALWNKDALEDEEEGKKWTGPYMEKAVPNDGWGRPWIYRNPSEIVEGAAYDIISLGLDGEEGTSDDLTNHMGQVNEDGAVDEDFVVTPPGDGSTPPSGG